MMHHAIFGGCLRTDLAFPELRVSDACVPSWTLASVSGPAPACLTTPLGEEQVTDSARVALFATPAGFRLRYDDTGTFDVSSCGRDIVWYRGTDAADEAARIDVMGRVLAVALHASGCLTLHGSAVALGPTPVCVAFVAPKRHGKSTLAMALANAGARLITDDTLPVDPGPPATAWPGVHSVRLWPDSLGRVAGAETGRASALGDKTTLATLASERLMTARVPLAAVYMLHPVPSAPSRPAAVRRRYDQVSSALAIVRHAKIGGLLRGVESVRLLEQATVIAREVPVYGLAIANEFDALPAVAQQLLDWHDEPVSA